MKNNFDLNLIRKWWFLIIFFGGALIWLVRLEGRVSAQEIRFIPLVEKVERILLNQVRMQKDIEFIKTKVNGF